MRGQIPPAFSYIYDTKTMTDINLIDDLKGRGLIAQQSGDAEKLTEHLKQTRTLYCGFDPTADSLHIGHLVPLLMLKRFQQAGHRPIALIGGATGMIGDPSFKATERSLNTVETVDQWIQSISNQLARFIDFDCGAESAMIANNRDWMGSMDIMSFLRDIGKHFSVNAMINKESVRQRIDARIRGSPLLSFPTVCCSLTILPSLTAAMSALCKSAVMTSGATLRQVLT